MKNLNTLDWITLVLIIIGALNWGLVGLFSFDLVAYLFGTLSLISRIIYVVIGLSAIYVAAVLMQFQRK